MNNIETKKPETRGRKAIDPNERKTKIILYLTGNQIYKMGGEEALKDRLYAVIGRWLKEAEKK